MQDYSKHTCELKTEEEMDAKKFEGNWRKKAKTRLRSLFLISKRNFKSHLYLRTQGAIQKEIVRQKNSKHWCVVHPFSLLRLCWEIVMFGVCSTQTLFIPIKSSFLSCYMAGYYQVKGRSLDDIFIGVQVDFALSVVCALDMLGFFFTGYYDSERRQIIMVPSEIFKNYFFPTFIIDLSASIPADALIVFSKGLSYYAGLSQGGFIALELYNWYRLVRFRRHFYYISRRKNPYFFSSWLFQLMMKIFIFIFIIHWMGALSIIVPQMIQGRGLYMNKNRQNDTDLVYLMEMGLSEQYLSTLIKALQNILAANESAAGLYYAEEYVIAILSNLIGKIFFIVSLISLTEGVTAGSALKVKLRIILDELKIYMKNKDLPMNLKKRLSRFYLYRFQAHYFSNRAMLGRLTESLRKEISMFTCQRLLHNTELFQSIPNKILTRFVQRMNREIYFPKDVIIQGNTFGECMYFICSGEVIVETLAEKEICRLGDGDFFGEIALIVPDRRRTATIKALSITEVYRLEYSDYKDIIELYPDVYNRLEKFALERYKTTVLLEEKQDFQYRQEFR